MTASKPARIEVFPFTEHSVNGWHDQQTRHHNWPVVYLLKDTKNVYVGETTRARLRLRQHLAHPERKRLREARVIIHEEFNKSACLDLEAHLIAWLHADTGFAPLNRNDGQHTSQYFERNTRYQAIFDEIFDQLRAAGIFSRSAAEIENLNLFKLSPFKTLNDEQLNAVDHIVEGLFSDLHATTPSTGVIQGGPGTGKTIVAIYLLKLLMDIKNAVAAPEPEESGRFDEYFRAEHRTALSEMSIAFVVPQQSLRKTIEKVCKRTPGLAQVQVLSPYTVAASQKHWGLLIVDETHRLTHRGSGPTRGAFNARNHNLYGDDASGKTAIDWIITKSDHQIFLIDGEQTVRPADVPQHTVQNLIGAARRSDRFYSLESQMRVAAGEHYLDFCRMLLTSNPIAPAVAAGYDLQFYDDAEKMRADIRKKDEEFGLSRMLAGYAWPWVSQNDLSDTAPYDIELDGARMRWNRTPIDWIAAEGSSEEVGSVHTVQGYDLNYAGVIIGPDVVWDDVMQAVTAVPRHHYDREVRSVKDSAALLDFIRNAYYVLLTRGIRGTYIYVADPALRERIRSLFTSA